MRLKEKLALSKETLARLDENDQEQVAAGGTYTWTGLKVSCHHESVCVCI
jgi:hypothetical protein